MAAEKSSATPFFACYRPKKAPREPKSDKTAHRKLIYRWIDGTRTVKVLHRVLDQL
jgi:hypothetical protein